MKRLFFITGAGLSAESGIPTFRETGGLWEDYDVDEICNIATFYINYNKVHNFYNKLRVNLQNYEPNEAHHFIAEQQKKYNATHITTNVDDLAERANGSVLHLHGILTEVVENYNSANEDYSVLKCNYNEYIPKDGVIAKPNVVMFGESITFIDGKKQQLYKELYEILDSLTKNDTVIIIGSSDTVLNFSSKVGLATNAYTVNVNPKKNTNDSVFDVNIYKPVTEALEELSNIIEERLNVQSVS